MSETSKTFPDFETEEPLILSERDFLDFIAALESEQEPSEKLKALFRDE